MAESLKQDYYINKEGFVVFTAEFLKNRGYCCGNGCLHCPFEYESVKDERTKARFKENQKSVL